MLEFWWFLVIPGAGAKSSETCQGVVIYLIQEANTNSRKTTNHYLQLVTSRQQQIADLNNMPHSLVAHKGPADSKRWTFVLGNGILN